MAIKKLILYGAFLGSIENPIHLGEGFDMMKWFTIFGLLACCIRNMYQIKYTHLMVKLFLSVMLVQLKWKLSLRCMNKATCDESKYYSWWKMFLYKVNLDLYEGHTWDALTTQVVLDV